MNLNLRRKACSEGTVNDFIFTQNVKCFSRKYLAVSYHVKMDSNMKRPLFISFEGIDGSGKTTQSKLLYQTLQNRGIPCVLVRDPYDSSIGEEVIKLVENNDLDHVEEAFLFTASRMNIVREKIQPALDKDQIVICDRFSDSTWAYQEGTIFYREIQPDLKPDITFLLDIPTHLALRRRNECSMYSYSKLDPIRKKYLQLAEEEPDRFVVIDGLLLINEMQDLIFETVKNKIQSINGDKFDLLIDKLKNLVQPLSHGRICYTDYDIEFHQTMVQILVELQCEYHFIQEKYDSVCEAVKPFQNYQEAERWICFFSNCCISPTNFAPQYNHLGRK